MVPTTVPPPYVPAPHLVASSGLSAPQLIALFEDFRNNAQYVSVAPSLVFERLAANLNDALKSAAVNKLENQSTSLKEREDCQASNDRSEKELAELRKTAGKEDSISKNDQTAPSPNLENQQTDRPASGDTMEKMCNLTIGGFDTLEVRSAGNARMETSMVIKFSTPYSAPPGLAGGLTMLDLGNHVNPRIRAEARRIQKDSFEMHLDSWQDASINAARCEWLEIAANDPDFQHGSYDTYDDHDWHHPTMLNERKIVFRHPYPAPPIVVVWLTAFDLLRDRMWRVKVFATDITKNSFNIHVDTWGNSVLYGATATWVAYPSTKPGIFSGKIQALGNGSSEEVLSHTTGFEGFKENVFSDTPQVLLALDSFDIDHRHPMRIAAKASEVTPSGFTWRINTWLDSTIYSAGASYIAFS